MKSVSITLNQAKMYLSNFIIEEFGFNSENILEIVEAIRTKEDMQEVVDKLLPHLKYNQSKNLISLWSKLKFALNN